MNVLSICSGISAAGVAWAPLGYRFKGYAEIEPYPCHVLHHRWGVSRPKYLPDPDEAGIGDEERKIRRSRVKAVAALPEEGIPNLGDFTQIRDDDLEALGPIDVVELSLPCQPFSVAGKRDGLNDPRGGLAVQFCMLLERMRRINHPKYLIMEQVCGILTDKTNGLGTLLAALAGEQHPLVAPGGKWPHAGYFAGPSGSGAWRVLNAERFGVPQRRRRVFLVANLGDGLADPAEILFEPKGAAGRPPAGQGAG